MQQAQARQRRQGLQPTLTYAKSHRRKPYTVSLVQARAHRLRREVQGTVLYTCPIVRRAIS